MGNPLGGTSLLATALPSIVQGLSGLLGGFFAGGEKAKERKWAEDLRQTKMADAARLKPTTPRANIENNIPQFASMISSLLGGSASKYLGDSAKASGFDFSKMFAGMPTAQEYGGWQRQAPQPAPGGNFGGGGGPMPNQLGPQPGYVNSILNKYGMERGA